jgi:hypothetical protein
MKTILVVANQTIGGAKLFETIHRKAAEAGGDMRLIACVPRNRPKYGNVIYDDAVYDAAQIRIDLARQVLRAQGIPNVVGEIGDPDPYSATMDAVAEFNPDEIVISTLPATSSGWLRRDLVERVQQASGLPVEHVVVDIDAEGLPFNVTLVVAARTAAGTELHDRLKAKVSSARDVFIFVVPQEGGEGHHTAAARARLAQVLDLARAEGLVAAGMIGDPDPYTATMNAIQLFRIDDVVISTLPATKSGWMRADLIERVRKASGLEVEHVAAEDAGAPATA